MCSGLNVWLLALQPGFVGWSHLRISSPVMPSPGCTPSPPPITLPAAAGQDKVTLGPPQSQGRRRAAGELPQLAARARGGRFSAGGPELRVGPRAQPEARVPAMATAKPLGRGCGALPRWLLGAALLLGLRLCTELRQAGSGPPGRRDAPGPPRTHLLPAPGPPRGARRRQVTYVRSGRRALPRGGGSATPPEPSCCAQQGLPRRKVSCKPCRHGSWS